jgi:hypothetical protein
MGPIGQPRGGEYGGGERGEGPMGPSRGRVVGEIGGQYKEGNMRGNAPLGPPWVPLGPVAIRGALVNLTSLQFPIAMTCRLTPFLTSIPAIAALSMYID